MKKKILKLSILVGTVAVIAIILFGIVGLLTFLGRDSQLPTPQGAEEWEKIYE